MNTKIILLFILSLIFLISCQANNYILDNSTSNVTKVEIKKCGIQECHGPDFSCGTEVREVCTLEYSEFIAIHVRWKKIQNTKLVKIVSMNV